MQFSKRFSFFINDAFIIFSCFSPPFFKKNQMWLTLNSASKSNWLRSFINLFISSISLFIPPISLFISNTFRFFFLFTWDHWIKSRFHNAVVRSINAQVYLFPRKSHIFSFTRCSFVREKFLSHSMVKHCLNFGHISFDLE